MIYVGAGVVESEQKAELIARYRTAKVSNSSLDPVASIDEHSANCLEPGYLTDELDRVRGELPSEVGVTMMLQNPEDHVVSYLNEFSRRERQKLESSGQKTSPGGVLLPGVQSREPSRDISSGGLSPTGTSLIDMIRAEAYRVQPEMRNIVKAAFYEL